MNPVGTSANRIAELRPNPVVLGIETSCDETAVAVVVGGEEIRANLVHSQVDLHAKYGGVVPEVAGRSHLARIVPLVRMALDEAGASADDIDAVAVTNRPGLVGCLLVGVSVAKTIAMVQDIPLIGIDHLQAHVDAAFLTDPKLALPMLSLVASGGHTGLYRVDRRGEAVRIGRTRDDAAGEALDKAAAMLGLGYPGGPALERAAECGDAKAQRFPRGKLSDDSLDFSFSGMKTSLLYHLRGPGLTREMPTLDEREQADLAASFQEAVVDTLVKRVCEAAKAIDAKTIAIGGGVARNGRLRTGLREAPDLAGRTLVYPPLPLCSDNGAMIAGLGGHEYAQGRFDSLEIEVAARSKSLG